MKNGVLIGLLSALAVLGLVSILTPAKAADDGMPVGTILAWSGDARSLPAGWMLCDGKAMNNAVYKDLFAVIGRRWGGSGFTFYLPDLRGRFLRGDDAGTGRDPDATRRAPSKPGGSATGVGSVQEDSFQNHTHDQTPHSHKYSRPYVGQELPDEGGGVPLVRTEMLSDNTSSERANIQGAVKYNTKSQVKTGEESRPKNAAVNFIIKVK